MTFPHRVTALSQLIGSAPSFAASPTLRGKLNRLIETKSEKNRDKVTLLYSAQNFEYEIHRSVIHISYSWIAGKCML